MAKKSKTKKLKTKKLKSKPKSTLRAEWSNALPQKLKSKPQFKKHTKAKPKPPVPTPPQPSAEWERKSDTSDLLKR